MATRIDVQQHARQRPLLAAPAMGAALPRARHQARRLQRRLHPAVAQCDGMLAHQDLLEVAHIEVEVLLAIELQHLLDDSARHFLVAGAAAAQIQQAVVAVRGIPRPPPPHLPRRPPIISAACSQDSCPLIARDTTS